MEKQQKKIFLNLILLILILGLMALIVVLYSGEIIEIISNPGEFRNLLISFGSFSILIFIGIQILAVLLVPVPGEFVIIAGGYIYGTMLGTLYSLIGILSGSIIVFSFSKYFGYSLVRLLVPPKRFAKFNALMNHRKSDLTIFFLYLMPQIPKGILTYIAGLTPITPVKFIAYSTIARIPCIIGASYIGANLREQDFLPVIIILVVTGILLIISFVMRERIIHNLHKVKNIKKSINTRFKS
jgi:uncharacterized membrane protein YdjX (TVP38/TMEM64 family)